MANEVKVRDDLRQGGDVLPDGREDIIEEINTMLLSADDDLFKKYVVAILTF